MTSIKHFLAEQREKKALIPVEEEQHEPKAKRFMKLLTKKNITVVSLIAVIGLAVYLNWAFNPNYKLDATNTLTGDAQAGAGDKTLGDTVMVGESAPDDGFFAASLVDRQRARDQAIETLQAVVYNAESMPDVKNNALAEIASIAKDVEQEAAIQTLIKGKGFKECIAVINGDNCNVIVQSSGLMANEVSQIKEIVYEQAKIMPDKIKIIEKN